MKATRWLAMALLLPTLPAAFLALLYALSAVAPSAAPWRHDTIQSMVGPAMVPSELPQRGWLLVRLRDWARPLAGRHEVAWYRMRFAMPKGRAENVPNQPWAVFIDQAYSRLTFYVNGAEIGRGGPDTGVVPVLRSPLWIPIPPALHRRDGDTLHIRSESGVTHTSLDRVHIGPAAVLQPAYEHAYAIKRWLRDMSLAVMLAASLIFGMLAFLRRHDSFYTWAAGTVFAWTLCMLHRQFDLPPVHPALWEVYGQATLGWFVLAGTVFTHRIVHVDRPRLERAIRIWAVAGPVLLAVAQLLAHALPDDSAWRAGIGASANAFVWLPSLLAAGVYMLALLSVRLANAPDVETAWFWAIAAIVFGVAAHDYVTYFLWISPGSPQFLSYTSLALLVGLAVIVLRRFTAALSDTEALNRDLERRVATKAREIEQHLGRTMQLEREHALANERERITRDMHDGLGGQLVAALALCDAPANSALVRETLEASLQELRLLIDSAEPTDGDLLSVLGMLRMRSARRLEAAGIAFDWQVQDLPALPDLEPHRVLQLMRILQEALTNALKHSGATRITVRTGLEAIDGRQWVRIDILDDGRGVAADAPEGRGLANMRRRARELDGHIALRNVAGGCALSLWLPAPGSTG